ncbi:hypothetical protein [Methanococcus maripaludis]|uniref:Uncharacterized protein n=1 Tax=Methanococcus maripaludis TaxID=39152 RepID=A0A8T3VXH3_METMI|nr:hypothetical protein [Methanococcus maripaludis]MBG0769338.1 hypothetical protein [Methanococcus maripaludis]
MREDNLSLFEKLGKMTEQNFDSEKINKVATYILENVEITVTAYKDKFSFSVPDPNGKEISNKLGIIEQEVPLYFRISLDYIGKSLKEMVIGDKAPVSPLEKEIYDRLNVKNLKMKTLLKKEAIMPVFESSKLYNISRTTDEKTMQNYVLKIEYGDSEAISFEITKDDLKTLCKTIKEKLGGK